MDQQTPTQQRLKLNEKLKSLDQLLSFLRFSNLFDFTVVEAIKRSFSRAQSAYTCISNIYSLFITILCE